MFMIEKHCAKWFMNVEGLFFKSFNLIKWILVLIKETLTPQNQFYKALG
jgi:hypothetical protein